MVTTTATKILKGKVEVGVWEDLRELCGRKGDLRMVVEEALKFYMAVSTDPHSISRRGDRGRMNRPKFRDHPSRRSEKVYMSFRIGEDVWKSFREFVERSGEKVGDTVDRALKLYLGALQGTLAWMDTYIPGTPDYIRSLVNVAYDFNLPLLAETLGPGSGVRVVPVEGDAGKEVVACIVREALECRDSDGELPDDSPSVSFRKEGYLVEYPEDVDVEKVLGVVREGYEVEVRVHVGRYGSVIVDEEEILVNFI